MKLAFFNDYRLGVVNGDSIVDVSSLVQDIPHVGPGDLMTRLIERFDQYRPRIEQASKGAGVPLDSVRLRPPAPKPGKMVGMVANYLEHGARTHPSPINAFLKSPSAVIGDGDTIVMTDAPATIFHHEAEVALVIGKTAKNITEAQVAEHIFGYMNFCDASARNLGPPGSDTYFTVKSPHTFAPMGPYLVTREEIANHQDIHMRLWVDGTLRHDYSTSDMGYTIDHTIAWISSITTLNVGDVVSLGTNHQEIGPIQDGEHVEMEGEGLGRLHFNISDRLKRKWPVGIDHEMADRVAGRTRAAS